ncbi:alpha/beta hydrolase [Flavobacterium sp. GSP27]|uniref:Alpha/beta hydrolase n=1 Tax=Flavobacterium bomense TaxID=2497483 RepID=A0A3S0MK11_9FLAO|nr:MULTISPECIES: alpha/beta hydrolase [Flavobacterium]RTY82085.1 alpha/beta hydrolase [Flavobacterium sp. LS1P28]RTY84651.1 alpha/beta hydrolase [Flavobacterium sp. ZB4P23]RTY91975.1 alpha/beta hydrolase [Flavobacterium sp. RSP46]RTZ05080.1 alpha/beta hydrolase [Flavobacterium sp. GSP6]RTZ06410.1 alpha/beta hydrolase [Flavobacterium sp. GSP27]
MTKKSSNHTQSLKIPKIILLTSKLISFISPKLITLFAAKLFTTPIKHKIPKRELEMDRNSIQKLISIPAIGKEVVVYEYGKSDKKILLVHGWSGRGTQLFKIADELLKAGYSTISFDAPAHGKSPGKTTIMVDFIDTILEIEKQFGPFEAAIGHSLGGMSVLNAIKKGLKVNHAVVIGSGDVVEDIIDDFVAKLQLKPSVSTLLRLHFEKKYGEKMNSYSAFLAAKETAIPILVIHDNLDPEVPVKAGIHIHKYLKNGELLLTDGLGHRKILGNLKVIEKTVQFIQNK